MSEIAYLDSCIFIELLQKNNEIRYEACKALIDLAKANGLKIVTSAITIIEVNGPKPRTEEQSRKILDFFQNSYINVYAVDRRIAECAHVLVQKHSLTNLDAIHVATASLSKSNVLYTYDGKNKCGMDY